MTGQTNTAVLVAFVLSMLAAWLIVVGYNRIRRRKPVPSEGVGRQQASVGRPTADAGERRASVVAELMQAIVRREMGSDPAFAGRTIDFGTAADGSLEIWLDDKPYAGIDQIPDVRLRELIARAAEEFNRGSPPIS